MTIKESKTIRINKLLIFSLVVVIIVLGFSLVIMAIGNAGESTTVGSVDALANSQDECVTCHRKDTPGIVDQYGYSAMAAAEVKCVDCHEVKPDYPGAVSHEGTYVLQSPTVIMCNKCHEEEVTQFLNSRHALPAYVAYAGSDSLTARQLSEYKAISEGAFDPQKARNAIFALEGPEITQFACVSCHEIGKPALDGSTGECQKCHLRHDFSLAQARKPETCNNCHIGPDHPQWEIYFESAHGIAYSTMGASWNWDADPGTLTVKDFSAPTCSTCHMSGFGRTTTSHDVGDRLTWFLAAQYSNRRPGWEANIKRMQDVCRECHNEVFIKDFYLSADNATEAITARVKEADAIIQPLKDKKLLTSAPFDEPIDFVYFENWHHWGRTAKFGVWMSGADYTQWHGAYEMLNSLAELRSLTDEKLNQSNP